jgi:hypothetical protein
MSKTENPFHIINGCFDRKRLNNGLGVNLLLKLLDLKNTVLNIY